MHAFPRLLVFALALAGCTTVVPMQTASTVPIGHSRYSAQLAIAPWCGLAIDPISMCGRMPRGFPTPEVRAAGRWGVTDGADVGASIRAAGMLERGFETGLQLDGKLELWRDELGDGRVQLASIGPGLGLGMEVLSSSFGGSTGVRPVLDVALPVFYGLQTESTELVVSPRALYRIHAGRESLRSVLSMGASLGLFTRGSTRYGVQLGYEAPASLPRWGNWTLAVGILHDES